MISSSTKPLHQTSTLQNLLHESNTFFYPRSRTSPVKACLHSFNLSFRFASLIVWPFIAHVPSLFLDRFSIIFASPCGKCRTASTFSFLYMSANCLSILANSILCFLLFFLGKRPSFTFCFTSVQCPKTFHSAFYGFQTLRALWASYEQLLDLSFLLFSRYTQ